MGAKISLINVNDGFIGRIQRGQDYPATWVEFDTNSGFADVSLIQGCDSAATITCTDGSCNGFTVGFSSNDVFTGAPGDAVMKKAAGNTALKNTEFNPILFVDGSSSAADYERQHLGTSQPYSEFVRSGQDGQVSDSVAPNKMWAVIFYGTVNK